MKTKKTFFSDNFHVLVTCKASPCYENTMALELSLGTLLCFLAYTCDLFVLDIDLVSVSSYSDDDEDSSLSDSEYIIVPMPDCFDLNKPLRDLTISSYSNSVVDTQEDFSLDDNHNNLSPSEL